MSTLVRDPNIHFGRFRVLRRTDGSLFVYDPDGYGCGAATNVRDLDEARATCKRLSDEATARGETNEPERQGFKLDWGDPKTWEAMAHVPPLPLFPSLHAKDEEHGEDEEERGPRSGPRRSAGLGADAAAAASGGRRP